MQRRKTGWMVSLMAVASVGIATQAHAAEKSHVKKPAAKATAGQSIEWLGHSSGEAPPIVNVHSKLEFFDQDGHKIDVKPSIAGQWMHGEGVAPKAHEPLTMYDQNGRAEPAPVRTTCSPKKICFTNAGPAA